MWFSAAFFEKIECRQMWQEKVNIDYTHKKNAVKFSTSTEKF